MTGLKAWLQDAVAALCLSDVHLLAETLRIDRHGCEDRHELERVIVNLVGLDQDSALGLFLACLLTASGLKSPWPWTFLPARVTTSGHKAEASRDDAFHTVLQTHLHQVHVLEKAVKDSERRVHSGSPNFQKLQQFFGHLTAVRDAEARTRDVLVRHVERLDTQCHELDATCVHLRAQVAFFVEGFTNLRHRHDALLTRASRLMAESESAQDVWMAISGHDGVWAHVVSTTLMQEGRRTEDVTRRWHHAQQDVEAARAQQCALQTRVRELHHARQAAVMKACCSKWQLRSWKTQRIRLDAVQKLEDIASQHDGMVGQRVLASFLDGFHEAVERDGTLSREQRHELLRRLLFVVQGSWKDEGMGWWRERLAMSIEDVARRLHVEEGQAGGFVVAVRAGGDAKTKKTRFLSPPKLLERRSKLMPKSTVVKGRKA